MKKNFIFFLCFFGIFYLTACGKSASAPETETVGSGEVIFMEESEKETDENRADENREESGNVSEDSSEVLETEEPETLEHFLDASGKNLEKRIRTPEGYERTSEKEGSLGNFLRSYKMKKDGSPVLLYDGKEKGNQNAHVAVFKLPLENEDLQQCADSVMRVYGEYYYQKGQYDKIQFSLGGGFQANFKTWSQGNGISVNGDRVSWVSSPGNNESYASFQKFMRIVFAYSGTMNLEEDSKKIRLRDIRTGDIFIRGGSPGHAVMVVDLCENAEGRKAFLLAQGYMPAQEFHVLKNPLHENDPWYYQDEISYPFETPEYTFAKRALRRPEVEG
ncbi:MAG: DUF4846 domain-containing protein [Lachnospiraceae bacterium]|nr:DUF4846 domain-containing protein [Lachnospiraceae bacterium]